MNVAPTDNATASVASIAASEPVAAAATQATTGATEATRRRSGLRWRLILGAGLGALLAMLLAAPSANAWPWDPNVHLSGRVACARPGDHPSQVVVMEYQPLHGPQLVPDRFGRYDTTVAVPAGGTAMVMGQVSCDGRGGHYVFQRHFPVHRPRWGNTVFFDLIG